MPRLQPIPVAPAVTLEAGQIARPRLRLLARVGRFLLTWGTPVAIGLFLGSVGSRLPRPVSANSSPTTRVDDRRDDATRDRDSDGRDRFTPPPR